MEQYIFSSIKHNNKKQSNIHIINPTCKAEVYF